MLVKDALAFLMYHVGRVINHGQYNVLSLYFHNPSLLAFSRIVNWLKGHGYEFIDMSELVQHVRGESELKHKSVFISLDDGWAGNMSLLPFVEREKIPVTIFLTIDPILTGNFWWEYAYAKGGQSLVDAFKQLSEEDFNKQLIELKKEFHLSRSAITLDELNVLKSSRYISFGSHTMTHPIMTNTTYETLAKEISESKIVLEKLLNKPVQSFSYPNGSYSQRELQEVSKIYDCSFSTIQGYPMHGSSEYEIPRIALTDDYWPNLAKIVGIWHVIRRLFKSK